MATYWENSCSFGLRYVSWYKYLIVSLVFSHLGFWSGNLFLIAPFPDLCLLVPFYSLLQRAEVCQDWQNFYSRFKIQDMAVIVRLLSQSRMLLVRIPALNFFLFFLFFFSLFLFTNYIYIL